MDAMIIGMVRIFNLIYYNSHFDTRVKSYGRLKLGLRFIQFFYSKTVNNRTLLLFTTLSIMVLYRKRMETTRIP